MVSIGTVQSIDDFRAAITYLVDFVSSRKGVAVWRSVLPQHFNSFDGHYQNGDNFTDCNQFTKRPNQNYNKAIDHAFDMYCNNTQKTHANKYEVECTMNQTSEEYRTVYNFFKTNNCTKRRKEVEDDNPIKTGAILRWNIADLFDVPQWHESDCSHFCYVMPAYEAAFERLDLLLPSLD